MKTINKLLNSLTLLSPLVSIGFNNQYQNTQKVITENDSALNGYFNLAAEQREMGDITVTVDGTKITGYVSGDGTLIVDSDITIIGNNAFDHKTVSGIDLTHANSLTTIEGSAFQSTRKGLMGNLFIPKNLSTIGDAAFKENKSTFDSISIDPANKNFSLCKNLGSNAQILISGNSGTWTDETKVVSYLACGDLVFPQTITKIANSAFRQCLGIKTLNFSNATSLTTIGEDAFRGCSRLSGDLVIPSGLKTIESGVFSSTSFSKVTINNNITSIAYGAFSSSKFNSLDLSNATSLTTIGGNAFYECTNITGDLIIPSSVENIGGLAFSNINLDNLYFSSETPPTSFGEYWQPTVTGKVYVPSEAAKEAYLGVPNFRFSADQIDLWTPPESKSNTGLILGLLFGLGIPIILAAGFGIWHLTKKKKTTFKI